MAVRIAHALGLHREIPNRKEISQYSPFEREMRRRLWWQLCLLDRQASGDRGSDFIIPANSFSTQLPLHVNDEDLIPNDPNEVKPREEFTKATLTLICHELFDLERRLNYVPARDFVRSQEKNDDPWSERRDWVVACQRRVEEKYLRHCDMRIMDQRYTRMVADIMIAVLWLCSYRPLQKHPDSPTSAEISPTELLRLSVEVVERSMRLASDADFLQFRWVSRIWVQWHALAIMIAELCVQTTGPIVERAWAVVNDVYEESARHIADSDKGRLWRPIRKLMNKARMVRAKHLENTVTISGTLPTEEAFKPSHQPGSWPNTQLSGFNTMAVPEEPTLPGDTCRLGQHLQPNVAVNEPVTMDWSSWVATAPADQMDYSNDLNQVSQINWESFLDDISGDGYYVSEQTVTLPQSLDVNF